MSRIVLRPACWQMKDLLSTWSDWKEEASSEPVRGHGMGVDFPDIERQSAVAQGVLSPSRIGFELTTIGRVDAQSRKMTKFFDAVAPDEGTSKAS